MQLVDMLYKVCSQLASTEVTECTHQSLCEEVWWPPCQGAGSVGAVKEQQLMGGQRGQCT